MDTKIAAEMITLQTAEAFGIRARVTVHDSDSLTFAVDSKKSADKLNEVWSKTHSTVLEKHHNRDTWYLTAKKAA